MTYLSHFWPILAKKVISREKVKTTVFATETNQNWPVTYFFLNFDPKNDVFEPFLGQKFAPPVGPKKSPWDLTFLGITAKQIRGTWKVHFIFFTPLLSSINGDKNFQKLANQTFHWFNKRRTHAPIG